MAPTLHMIRLFSVSFAIAVTFLFVSCETNETDVQSPTVQPADAASLQTAPANNAAAPAASGGMQTTYSGLQYQV